ncbi:hypothetical protein BGZ97_010722, partial [Linnemannia gamsii]
GINTRTRSCAPRAPIATTVVSVTQPVPNTYRNTRSHSSVPRATIAPVAQPVPGTIKITRSCSCASSPTTPIATTAASTTQPVPNTSHNTRFRTPRAAPAVGAYEVGEDSSDDEEDNAFEGLDFDIEDEAEVGVDSDEERGVDDDVKELDDRHIVSK